MSTQHKSTLSSGQRINTSSVLSTSSIRTTEQQQIQQQPGQQQTSVTTKKQRKRCRGNQKLRHFKKKCIKRGLNKEEIQKLIDEYNRKKTANQLPNKNIEQMREVATTTKNKETKIKSDKRKRMSTSTSLRFITQRIPKKMKKKNVPSINTAPIKPNYRLPKYLKKAPNLLFQSLRLQLKHKLKKKNEQRFLHRRLLLIDQQYRLNLHRNLWQSYLTLGLEHQTWPNQVYKLTNTNEHDLCQQFVTNRLIEFNRQYDQCTTELITQSQACPSLSSLLPLDKLDHNLKEFVHLQQNYISKKMNFQLTRYQDMIEERKLYQTLFTSYHPTNNQKETMDRLLQLRQTQLQVFEEVLQLETRVSIGFLPDNFDQSELFIAPDLYVPLIKSIEFKQKRNKILQEAKRTWLDRFVDIYEINYRDYEYQYQQDLKQFELHSSNHSHGNGGEGGGAKTTTTTTLFNSFITYMNHRTNRIKQEIYYEKIPLYRRKLLRLVRHRRHLGSTRKKLVNVCPQVIIDLIRHPFTATEIAYLSKGPTYIRSNQSALRPVHQREQQIDKQINQIMTKLKKYMANVDDHPRIPLTSPLYKFYSDRLRTYLSHRYMTPLSLIDQLRARRELRIVKSIQRKLKKYKLVLRETDKSGVFHIGRAIDYKRKAAEYRQKTGAYEELTSNPFNEIIYNTSHLLNQLRASKKITESQRIVMMPIRDKTELAYMYTLPKAHKKGTPLRPIMNTIHAATTKISKFLDKLIRPLFDRFVRETTIVDGVDLLDKLQQYIHKGYFKSSTLFITFDITNLYTMLPQEESLAILGEFLYEHHCETVGGIAIETIVELARLVLQTNAFVYDKKFYRQIIGGAMGSAFTLTLANIFMWKWEKLAILSELPSHELYGRYIDDVFFTSNQSEEKVKQVLKVANKYHPNIKLEYHIGKSVPFLDILLTNNNGILSSSVYHKPAAEPLVLSFLSDHPRHVFGNVIQTALMRAIRYSSTFEVFNIERRTIRLMLLYNSYPSTYINEQFQQFFMKYISSYSSSASSILPLIDNEQQFFIMREKLLAQPSIKQVIVAKSAAAIDLIHHVQNNRQPTTTTTTQTMQIIVKQKDNNNNNKFENTIFIHCVHEARFEGLQRHIHAIHDSFFKNPDHGDIRLIVGHQNNPNMEFELTRKRPHSSLLKDPSKKKLKPNEHPPPFLTT